MKKKYMFTGETMIFQGHTLQRIQYVEGVGFVRKGEVGGWIESESNLSHEGMCLILDEAKVFGNAKVMEDAFIVGESIVKDNAQVKGNVELYGQVVVGADTIVSENTRIIGEAIILFYATSEENEVNISGSTIIEGHTKIEATGTIFQSEINCVELSGHLKIEYKNYQDW